MSDTNDIDDDASVAQDAVKAEVTDDELYARALRWLLNNREGRVFLRRQFDRTGPFRTTFVQGHPDASAFRDGEANIGTMLLDDIVSVDAGKLGELMKESTT